MITIRESKAHSSIEPYTKFISFLLAFYASVSVHKFSSAVHDSFQAKVKFRSNENRNYYFIVKPKINVIQRMLKRCLIVVLYLCIISFPASDAKLYNKCELAKDLLNKHGFEKTYLANCK